MQFALTEQQELIRSTVRGFCDREVQPRARELDAVGEFPWDLWKRMCDLQLTGMLVPERYGGTGLDTLSYILAIEEISRACAGLGVALSVHNSVSCAPIVAFGSEELKERFLPRMARGEWLGGFMQSEPAAGSDAAGITTVAERKGDHYVLTGTKNFITNGDGHAFVTMAKTDRTAGHTGITAFVLTPDMPGFRLGSKEDKMGIRSSNTYTVHLDECRVPAADRLGDEGQGFKISMATLDSSRIGIGAQALGIAQGAFDESLRYAQERQAFGQPIGKFQAIQWKIAEMATDIDAARLLVYRAAWLKDRSERVTAEAAMAKLFASEMSHRVCHAAVQVFGGYGVCRDYPVERYYRDQRVTEIYEGTSEIQRLVIARSLTKGRS